MISITLKNGITHTYPDGKLDEVVVLERLKQEFWTINSDDNIEIYRTNEIAHVTISNT